MSTLHDDWTPIYQCVSGIRQTIAEARNAGQTTPISTEPFASHCSALKSHLLEEFQSEESSDWLESTLSSRPVRADRQKY